MATCICAYQEGAGWGITYFPSFFLLPGSQSLPGPAGSQLRPRVRGRGLWTELPLSGDLACGEDVSVHRLGWGGEREEEGAILHPTLRGHSAPRMRAAEGPRASAASSVSPVVLPEHPAFLGSAAHGLVCNSAILGTLK